jgi:hypothetical protein
MREIIKETFNGVITCSVLEPVTPEELEYARINFLKTGECDHALIQDEAGWLYDIRSCVICGTGRGTV